MTSAISPLHTATPSHTDEGSFIITYYALAISPQFAYDHTLFAFDGYDFAKSTDGGDSWYVTWNPSGYGYAPTNIAVSPNYLHDQTLLVGDQELGLFLSQDGGASWQQIPNTTPHLYYEPTFVGIRQVLPYQPWPPVPPSTASGPYHVYLPLIIRQQTPQLELWIAAQSTDEIVYPSPFRSHLHRSRDFGATWEEVFVFERSHRLYLPLVTHTIGGN